ncbi:MAG: radical SAM protein [Anaerolineales bacterium]|nr:MAG: radical SAM protein [Anaerolineales bacterium]
MQITFGCPAFCSFCFEGFDRKPYRELSLEDVWSTALALKKQMGPATLDLVSFNFNTYAGILPLLLKLSHLYDRVSFKSQRVDILAVMPGMLDAELTAGKRSYTIGVEGISGRMRAFLHKSLGNREIDNVINRLLHLKVREIKMFYILTGHETPSDIGEFRNFLRDLKHKRSGTRSGVRIVFSFGLLIRMPFTPLRYDRLFLEEQEWRGITGQVKSACETNGFEFRLAIPWADYATSQVLALGGYWLCDSLLSLAEEGYCYDSELAESYWAALKSWMQTNGHWSDNFLGEKNVDAEFPLEFLEQRISSTFLYQLFENAKAGVDDGYCLGEIGQLTGDTPDARCLACGACASSEERAAITQHRMQPPDPSYMAELSKTMVQKQRMKPLFALLWLPPETIGKSPAWLNAWVMRILLQAIPNQVENITLVRESLFSTRENLRRYAGLYGETVFAIYAWDVEAVTAGLVSTVSDMKGVRFLRWVNAFEPGTFQRAGLSITLPATHFPDAGQQLRRYLQDQYVPVNLRRIEDGYEFDIPKKALQKRIVYAGSFLQTSSTHCSKLVVSGKFDLMAYLQSFADPYWYNEAVVEVNDLEF